MDSTIADILKAFNVTHEGELNLTTMFNADVETQLGPISVFNTGDLKGMLGKLTQSDINRIVTNIREGKLMGLMIQLATDDKAIIQAALDLLAKMKENKYDSNKIRDMTTSIKNLIMNLYKLQIRQVLIRCNVAPPNDVPVVDLFKKLLDALSAKMDTASKVFDAAQDSANTVMQQVVATGGFSAYDEEMLRQRIQKYSKKMANLSN